MDTLLKDIRYGIRSLLKRPTFAAVAVLTLGLGIGVNSAIFSVINAVLLKPLPYEEPARLITFRSNQSGPDLVDIEAQSKTFSSFGGLGQMQFAYTAGAEPIQLQIGEVTGRFFETLGVPPERGRYISAADDKPGGPYVVVLGHELWVKQFNKDEQIVGKVIPLSDIMYTVIGVMPASFVSPRVNSEAWTPVRVRSLCR